MASKSKVNAQRGITQLSTGESNGRMWLQVALLKC